MRTILFLVVVLIISATLSSCSKGDTADCDTCQRFSWVADGLEYRFKDLLLGAYIDSILNIQATNIKDQVNITMGTKVESQLMGKHLLSDDNDHVFAYVINGRGYVTMNGHSVLLTIESVYEKDIEGTFEGEVENVDDPSDVIRITGGEFYVRVKH